MANDDDAADNYEPVDQPDYLSAPASGEPLTCASCGRPLGDSYDDQPDWATGPMCGDCYQARQMDDEIWSSDQDAEQGDST